ncbi:MAG: 3-deoxy-8-phosphooctulonate synthase [Deltaproteobacteria bacterium]|nr:3-deoxy-8-phosphooctulonate synthase [Deltaproteobacteria bacterium]
MENPARGLRQARSRAASPALGSDRPCWRGDGADPRARPRAPCGPRPDEARGAGGLRDAVPSRRRRQRGPTGRWSVRSRYDPAVYAPASLWPPGGPLLVAGPCALESEAMAVRVASELAAQCASRNLPFVFKASFDKANRTAGSSYRGPGLDEGLRWLDAARGAADVPILTDVHLPSQCAIAAEVADVLQIPAFLSRQTDLLAAAAATGRAVNLKKGQFLAPWQVKPALTKLSAAPQVWVTERGTSFGHGDLVVDFRSFVTMSEATSRLIFDASHSAQTPGGGGDRSAGDRRWIPVLSRAAAGAGYDGLYLEVHPDPATARSDRDTQWPLHEVGPLLDAFLAVRAARLSTASA